MSPLVRFAWAVLGWNLVVIVWGAYVRASGSGAGCGSHWPLCNGEVLPRSATVETLIEFSHRFTSGIALIGVLAMLVWVWRACRPGHPARTGAVLSLFFILTEAAVGAGLVLFELVADNRSMARALFMGVHLMNTFILVAVLTLTAWWLATGAPLVVRGRGRTWAAALTGAAALLIVGASGAIAALGDTLFPSASLAEALRADLSTTSHVLIRLRVLHPVLAVATGLLLLTLVPMLGRAANPRGATAGRAVVFLTLLQLGLGLLNVFLLAPIWLQLVHLLVADAIWIAYVLLVAEAVRSPAAAHEAAPLRTREAAARA